MCASVADTYVDAGFSVVIQDVIVGPMLKEFVDLIQSPRVYLVVLSPDEQTIIRREQSRDKMGYGAWTVTQLNQILQNDTPKIGMWIDNSILTEEETVEKILAEVESEGVICSSRYSAKKGK